MVYNFHTHTYRCHHASGTEEQYIQSAVKAGIKHMGFSDHIPFVFPDGSESVHRMYMRDIESYFSTLRELREKYRNDIEIFIGFEAEYYPKYQEKMIGDMIEYGAEYMILGQHYLYNELPDMITVASKNTKYEDVKYYCDTVTEAMETGYFTYVAHPDMLNFDPDDKEHIAQVRRICKKSAELDIPLEINFLGIRTNRRYPNEKFWKIAGEENSPVTFGFDAHEACDAGDTESVARAMEIVEKYNLNYIGMPKLKLLNKK